jgi:hypothetical protein
MKTVLKVLLVVVLIFVAIHLSPAIFVLTLAGLAGAAVLGVLGLSLLAIFGAVIIALVAALAPIWIPVLLIIGLVSLCKKTSEKPQSPSVTA